MLPQNSNIRGSRRPHSNVEQRLIPSVRNANDKLTVNGLILFLTVSSLSSGVVLPLVVVAATVEAGAEGGSNKSKIASQGREHFRSSRTRFRMWVIISIYLAWMAVYMLSICCCCCNSSVLALVSLAIAAAIAIGEELEVGDGSFLLLLLELELPPPLPLCRNNFSLFVLAASSFFPIRCNNRGNNIDTTFSKADPSLGVVASRCDTRLREVNSACNSATMFIMVMI